MDTITINAGQTSGEDKKGKEKISDSAKAAMATGAAGLAAGLASKSIYDEITDEPEPEPIAENHNELKEERAEVEETDSLEESIYINPDDVMIEDEPEAELIEDGKVDIELNGEVFDYPFISEDTPIDDSEDDVPVEPANDDERVLLAENEEILDVDPISEDDFIVDAFCQNSEHEVVDSSEMLNYQEGDILADNNNDFTDYNDFDIQSDIMG